jgi:hypothetical protein
MNEQDHTIINCFGAEYRGIVQYYLLAGDVHRLDRLHWVMQTSLLKTLAGKYGSTVTTMARRYKATIETPHGPHKCLQVSVERGQDRKPLVATFGGIPLRRQKHAALRDRAPVPAAVPGKELIDRLRAGRCEICGDADQVQIHQIRKLSDLDKPGQSDRPEWARIMLNRRRKTLVVCAACHATIHPRRPTASITEMGYPFKSGRPVVAAVWRHGRWTAGTVATRPGLDGSGDRRPVGVGLTTRLW